MKNQKRAQTFITKNVEKLTDKQKLFGSRFYKYLHKLSNDKKKVRSLEIQFSALHKRRKVIVVGHHFI